MTLLRSDAETGTTVRIMNTRTGRTQKARVDEDGIVREGDPPHGAAYSAGEYMIVDVERGDQ